MPDTTPRPLESLSAQLATLDGRDFAACQALRGSYEYDRFRLHIDQVPKDPYAPPGTGVFRVRVAHREAGFGDGLWRSPARATAVRDFLARRFFTACREICPGRRGTGNSGLITIAEPGQEVLDRTSVFVDDEAVEVRFFLGLPARGRSVDAGTARRMLLEELPRIVESSLFSGSLDADAVEAHLQATEDAESLRDQLPGLGLIAFVADGAVLPRASGVDPAPLREGSVVPFASPEELRVSVDLPHAGTVTGMGVPPGVTLIVGGGYHGKSTVLEALELGIYDHIPGDGRELCVCLPETVKVRAASGRVVTGVDISAFINNLPLGQDTGDFSTANASGSTSQAAFIAESVEMGARVLLMDEDTCAANFMIRDGRMQRLVSRAQEPITAFVDQARRLHDELGVSTVLVMGGSGDYFDVADRVVQMADFQPLDVTARARAVATAGPSCRVAEGGPLLQPAPRVPEAGALDPRNEYGHFRISAHDPRHLVYGQVEVDLSDVEQITETAQARAIGRAIDRAKRYMDGRRPLHEVIAMVVADVEGEGLDVLDPRRVGDLAGVRGLDVAAALNRFRGLVVRQA